MDLNKHIELWKIDDISKKPIGYILSLEGADSIVDIDYLEKSYNQGLRAIGPAHYGPGIYAHGTDSVGGIGTKGKEIEPLVTWGTSPQDVSPVTGVVPDPNKETNEDRKMAMKRSLEYMGLKANTKISDIKIDKIFIGSCTNGIE